MDTSVFRILDANFNRAREALRVLEDHARFVLDDADRSARAKQLRHELAEAVKAFGSMDLLAARDIEHDVGASISTDAERRRDDPAHVALAAAKRASEALRNIEEYGKLASADAAARIEQIRYKLYGLEQELLIGGPRRSRLRAARLYVLVTESLCRGSWEMVCEQALSGGADMIQLREKDLPDSELLARAAKLRGLTRRHNALLIINDRPDIARLADADGVHLGQTDMPVGAARRIVGPNLLIGTSAHSLEEARAALSQNIDYIAVGSMFASPTKPKVVVQGPELFAQVAGIARIPVVAIGGITAENVGQLVNVAAAVSQRSKSAKTQADVNIPPDSYLPPQVSNLKPQAFFLVAVCHAIVAAADPAAAARMIKSKLC